uniref:Uncharacterized protein n=1 Tax=Panagrolaimus sp. JU765 TaxID=591449 RepID=A0AC34PZX6_9BILA
MVNLYCLGTEIDRRHIVDEEGYRALSCSTGYTLEREKNTAGKTMYKCVKCHVGITAAGKFYPSCLKVCPDIAFPKYEYIRRYYPKFSISNYDKDVEYEEYELCSIIKGQIFFRLKRSETFMPPESSLWFVSRWQYSDYFSPADEDPDVKLFGNLRDTKLVEELKSDRKYNDLGLLNLPDYTKLGFGKNLWFRPLKKDSRFNSDELYSEKNSDFDCRCVMFTRCSQTDFNKSIEFKTDEDALPPNTIYSCHKACKAEGCVDKTVFGCKQCAKLDVWSHNLGRACAFTCPLGFFKERTLYKDSFDRCIRCHKGCRGGCTGPSAGKGKDGCNDCFSYISAPRNSSFDAICMGEGNDQMEHLEIINRIIRMLAVVS